MSFESGAIPRAIIPEQALTLINTDFDQTNSQRRKVVVNKNEVPSVSIFTNIIKGVVYHSYVRKQLEAIVIYVFHGIACGTDGSVLDVDVRIRGVALQIGKGTRVTPAIHPNGLSNVCDNVREHYIHSTNKKGVTPKKTKVFKIKGFSNKDIRYLEKHHKNIDKVRGRIEKRWPHASLIHGSVLEYIQNITHCLPRRVNVCDWYYETHFINYMENCIYRVMRKEIDPENAIKGLVVKTQNYFTQKIIEIKESIKATSDPTRIDQLKEDLLYHECELEGSQLPDLNRIKKDLGENPFELFRPRN